MSDLRVTTVSDLAGTGPADLTGQWASRARCAYDQTVPVIRGSGNVSSVTDSSAGKYEVNFTANFSDIGYAGVSDAAKYDSTDDGNMSSTAGGVLGAVHTTALEYVRTPTNTTGSTLDSPLASYAAFGDLA